MNDEELVVKLFEAYGLIGKLAKATDIMLGRLITLEATVAVLEADAAMRKASAK